YPRSHPARWFHACANSLSSRFRRNGLQQNQRRMQKATRESEKIIINGLQQLNPSIPVISAGNTDIPYSERMNWSYLWLVDPLNEADNHLDDSADLTVNIALIEGSKPVWGVVYNTLDDTVYYAKGASGSYKISGDNSPAKLARAEVPYERGSVVTVSGGSVIADDIRDYIDSRIVDCNLVFTGSSTALCMLAEGTAAMHISLGSTCEWETAAGHAIARSSGCHAYNYGTSKELEYNKENLINDRFIAE
ncbi:MAG: inositol monophosphatase family protein, partial [Gammaproteobacteria bacterium]